MILLEDIKQGLHVGLLSGWLDVPKGTLATVETVGTLLDETWRECHSEFPMTSGAQPFGISNGQGCFKKLARLQASLTEKLAPMEAESEFSHSLATELSAFLLIDHARE